jgi:uncharacterized repeat protein (TIGR01451 family)
MTSIDFVKERSVNQMNRKRVKLIWSLVVLTILVMSTGTGVAGLQQEDDFFYNNGEPFPIRIALDQVGLLALDGVTAEQIKAFASQFELQPGPEFNGNIFIFNLSQPFTRDELVQFVRQIRQEGEQLIAQAGLVVRPIEAETPMILTDQFIAEFGPNVSQQEIDAINDLNSVEVVMENPFVENQFLLTVTEASQVDALTMANRYHESDLTEFAHPNFVEVVVSRQTIPSDPLFGNQWPHRNTGQSAGTVDADVDTSWAWDITQGAAGTIIAVIDSGFDMTHPDLTPNFWQNPAEVANGVDDGDANVFVDDINGWDFTGCDVFMPPANCGDNNPTGGNHGTSVAGVAAAKGNNNIGVTGSCPNCNIILIRLPATDFAQGLAFNYAQQMGADIITNSWGFAIGVPCATNLCNAINNAAMAGRGGLGSVVFFAMNNPNVNDCVGPNPDISSLANVIAISRSTNRDQFDFSGFGNCMDLIAPSAGLGTVPLGRGTLWVPTTDVVGAAGFNNTVLSSCPSTEPAPPPADARDYTLCFNGTSAATPLVAGIGALILDVNPGLTRLQVQQLLRDTADKIEDSTGRYATNTGFSSPATGQATHGWGRVNAFEAVRVAAPVADGGKGGADIFVRDNRLDWGNATGYLGEQGSNILFEPTRGTISHSESVDIKVDAPPYQPAPTTSAAFDTFVHENALSGALNHVYVRVRNRGPVTVSSITAKLHWVFTGAGLPNLPSDFWTAFPAEATDTSQVHPLNVRAITSLAYSGSSVASTPADAAQIVQFDFPGPAIDPTQPNPNQFSLLAVLDSGQDPIDPNSETRFMIDDIVPNDNNISQLDMTVESVADLSITKSASPDPVTPGSTLTYTLTAKNNGPADATNVIVTDTLPAGVTLVSATPSQGTCSGGVTCNLGNLASGASATITIEVTVDAATACGATLSNLASVVSDVPDPDLTNNTASAATRVDCPADLSISKSAPSTQVTAGNDITYTLTVKNHGPSDATVVTATDILPEGVTLVSVTTTQGTCDVTVTCNLGNLASGAIATITIVVTVDPATPSGSITNTATVSGNETDPAPGNNEARAETPVLGLCGSLDDFNRPDGLLGSNWDGRVRGYRIRDNQVVVRAGGPVYWQPESYGPDQEGCVTLTRINPRSRQHALLLKVQELNNWRKGAILVSYNARSGNVDVKARDVSARRWILVGSLAPSIPVVDGDQLRAQARADGTVEVFINNVSIGAADAGSFYVDKGGQIGLWFRNPLGGDDDDGDDEDDQNDKYIQEDLLYEKIAGRRAILDDFGGGTIAAP